MLCQNNKIKINHYNFHFDTNRIDTEKYEVPNLLPLWRHFQNYVREVLAAFTTQPVCFPVWTSKIARSVPLHQTLKNFVRD